MPVPQDLLPVRVSNIDICFAQSKWPYANHFSKDLPKNNPSHSQLFEYCEVLRTMHRYTCDALESELLDYNQGLARKYGYNPSDNIADIHRAVLASSSECSDEYLCRVLEFIKLPQKHTLQWLTDATERVKDRYGIEFILNGKGRNFVAEIARALFNDTHNQRLRRGMLKNVGVVWYDRKPQEKNLHTLFGSGCETKQDMKVLVVCKLYRVTGCLVRKVGYCYDAPNDDAPESAPAAVAAVGLESNIMEVINGAGNEDAFIQQALRMYRQAKQVSVTFYQLTPAQCLA